MDRRGFLKSMLALGAATTIVKAESLMRLYVPRQEVIVLWGDGIHDDTKALQTWIDGGVVLRPDRTRFDGLLGSASVRITDTINLDGMGSKVIANGFFRGEGLGQRPMF